MLYGKLNRIIWGILSLTSLIGAAATDRDMTIVFFFALGSGILFIIDYLSVKSHYDRKNKKALLKMRWHVFSNLAQWLFWTAVLYLIFVSDSSLGYKIFILTDLFIVATFALYKYKKGL